MLEPNKKEAAVPAPNPFSDSDSTLTPDTYIIPEGSGCCYNGCMGCANCAALDKFVLQHPEDWKTRIRGHEDDVGPVINFTEQRIERGYLKFLGHKPPNSRGVQIE